MTGPRRPRGPRRPKGFADVPELSPEEVERRIGGSDDEAPPSPAPPSPVPADRPRGRRRARAATAAASAALATPIDDAEVVDPLEAARLPEQDAAVTAVAPVASVTTAHREPALEDALADRRRVLWRDSATILIGVIVAILAYQTFVPAGTGVPTGSGTAIPSGVAIGSLPPPRSLPPGVTFGPIIDPSLGVDATPTPIPVITLGPSPSPSPSPEPSATRKPSPKPSKTPGPSVGPSIVPTPGSTPVITPPPPPPPTAVVTCEPPVFLTVTCRSESTNFVPGSEDWHMGGDGVRSGGGDGFDNITWTYAAAGPHTVTLTVTGLDGVTKDTDTAEVTVVAGP